MMMAWSAITVFSILLATACADSYELNKEKLEDELEWLVLRRLKKLLEASSSSSRSSSGNVPALYNIKKSADQSYKELSTDGKLRQIFTTVTSKSGVTTLGRTSTSNTGVTTLGRTSTSNTGVTTLGRTSTSNTGVTTLDRTSTSKSGVSTGDRTSTSNTGVTTGDRTSTSNTGVTTGDRTSTKFPTTLQDSFTTHGIHASTNIKVTSDPHVQSTFIANGTHKEEREKDRDCEDMIHSLIDEAEELNERLKKVLGKLKNIAARKASNQPCPCGPN